MTSTLGVRDVVLVDFPAQIPPGREQQGKRPAIVVVPTATGSTRFSLVVVVPITRQSGEWVRRNPTLYPSLESGAGNLTHDSIVLLDQIRAVDIRRVLRYVGTLTPEQYQPISDGLNAMLNF